MKLTDGLCFLRRSGCCGVPQGGVAVDFAGFAFLLISCLARRQLNLGKHVVSPARALIVKRTPIRDEDTDQ